MNFRCSFNEFRHNITLRRHPTYVTLSLHRCVPASFQTPTEPGIPNSLHASGIDQQTALHPAFKQANDFKKLNKNASHSQSATVLVSTHLNRPLTIVTQYFYAVPTNSMTNSAVPLTMASCVNIFLKY